MSKVLLAIDVSSVALGYAYGNQEHGVAKTGVFPFGGTIFERWSKIRTCSRGLMEDLRPDLVYIEAPFPATRSSMAVLQACYGAFACCIEGLRSIGADPVEIVPVVHGSWRKKILGAFPKGKSPKGDVKKALTMERVLAKHPGLAIHFVNDKGFDASDACGIFLSQL